MKLTSPAFDPQGFIPELYTCKGADISPPLQISEIPEGTQSLALIVDDPDAPMGTFVHWVLYDISPTTVIGADTAPGTQGINDFQNVRYGGPCPPGGTHRYYFKLYALDRRIELPAGKSKQDVESAMRGHILEQTEIMAKFAK